MRTRPRSAILDATEQSSALKVRIGALDCWHYPKGGKEYRTIKVSAKEGFLTAVTVSLASKH
jgi:hypothetical protein